MQAVSYTQCVDNKSRNTDFFISRAAELLVELEGMVTNNEFTETYLRIRALLTVLLEPTSGFDEPERDTIMAIEQKARELMKAHDQATEHLH